MSQVMRMLVSNVKPLVNPRLITATRQFASARKFYFLGHFKWFLSLFLQNLINALTFAIVTLLFSCHSLSRKKSRTVMLYIESVDREKQEQNQ